MSEPTYIRHHLVEAPEGSVPPPDAGLYNFFAYGYFLVLVAFLIVTVVTALLAVRGRFPGAWLALSGLAVGWLFFIFQNLSGFMLDPLSDLVAVGVYGVCGLLSSLGFARMGFYLLRWHFRR